MQTEMKDITLNVCEKLLSLAPNLMVTSSKIAMRHYADLGEVMEKGDKSPLTAADLEVDQYLYAQLSKEFPTIPIVTEERAQSHDLDVSNGMFFMVDPIDGTKEFINKRDEFTVNIALIENRKPIAGIVCAPALNLCYTGATGLGAFEENLISGQKKTIKTRIPDNSALLVVASRSHLTQETKAFIDANNVADTKNSGSSLKFCLLARGDADLYPRFGPTMEWDTAAAHAILLAAGGRIENLDGTALEYAKAGFRNSNFIASGNGVKYAFAN